MAHGPPLGTGIFLRCVLSACLLVWLGQTASARGASLLISADGSGDAPTVQAACIAASAGDTLLLANGIFRGDGNWDVDFLNKSLVLRSRGGDPDSCILDCADDANRHRAFLIYNVEGQPVIDGITIRNTIHDDRGGAIFAATVDLVINNCKFDFCQSDYHGGGIYLGDGGSATLTDCAFLNNRADNGAAIMASNADLILNRCVFRDNRAVYQGGAVFLTNARDSRLQGCWFENNRADFGGAFVGNVCQVVLQDCTFFDNQAADVAGAVYLAHAGAWGRYSRLRNCSFVSNRGPFGSGVHVAPSPASLLSLERTLLAFGELGEAIYSPGTFALALEYCDLYGNEGGDWTGTVADHLGRKGNVTADPLFCNRDAADLRVHDISVCLPANNEFHVQIGAHGEGCTSDGYVVYPDGSATLRDIQTGVLTVPVGGVLELADGIFSGPGNRDIDFMGKAITVRSRSGDPAACIIDCEGSLAMQHRGFIWRNGEGPGSCLENVTVRNGHAPEHGGALYIDNASPTLRNCRFSNCTANQFGGAVAVWGQAAPLLVDCVLDDNSAIFGGGLYAGEGSAPGLIGCTLVGNQAGQGGGIMSLGATVVCAHTLVVLGTGGGAVTQLLEGSVNLTCSDLYGNTGGDWVGNLADQLGHDGNRSADPCFCDPGSDIFTLCADSWCLPENNPDGCPSRIGALGASCEACSCELGTHLVIHDFRGLAHLEAGSPRVVLSWRLVDLSAPRDFLLRARLGAEQWTVPIVSWHADVYQATDHDARLQAASQVDYLLLMQDAGTTAWREVAQTQVTIPAGERGVWLLGTWPNPFNPRTKVAFMVDRPQRVRLTLHDLRGHGVATLVDAVLPAGYHAELWDGTDSTGNPVAAGTYLVRLSSEDSAVTEKIVLLK